MTIRIHLFFSFLIHAIILTYLLSLPLYKGSIHLKPFGDYFVYLRDEQGNISEKPFLTHKVNKSKIENAKAAEKITGIEKEIPHLLEPEKDEKASKEEIPAIKKEENKPEDLEVEEPPPVAKEPEEPMKPQFKAKPDEGMTVVPASGNEAKETELKAEEPLSPPLSGTDAGLFPETVSDNTLMPFEPGLGEEAAHGKKTEDILAAGKQSGQGIERPMEKKTPDEIVESKDSLEHSGAGKILVQKAAPSIERKGGEVEKAETRGEKVSLKEEASALDIVSSGAEAAAPEESKGSKEKVADVKLSEEIKFRAGEALSPALPGKNNGRSPMSVSDNGTISSVEGKNENHLQEDHLLKQSTTDVKSELKGETRVEEEKLPSGVPVSAVLLLRDIKIKVSLEVTDMSPVLFHLFKRSHPKDEKRNGSMKQKEIDIAGEIPVEEQSGVKRVLYVTKADKGIYTFVLENKGGEIYRINVIFHLMEGKAEDRIKEYKTIELSPHGVVKFKFMLPEAVFWDDEYCFTGMIESSDTLTKFNDETGLVWKEEKDY